MGKKQKDNGFAAASKNYEKAAIRRAMKKAVRKAPKTDKPKNLFTLYVYEDVKKSATAKRFMKFQTWRVSRDDTMVQIKYKGEESTIYFFRTKISEIKEMLIVYAKKTLKEKRKAEIAKKRAELGL